MLLIAPALRVLAYGVGLPQAAYQFTFCRMDGLAIGAILALAIRDAHDWGVIRRLVPYARVLAVVGLTVIFVAVGSPGFGNLLMDTLGLSLIALLFGCSLFKTLEVNGGLLHTVASWRFFRFFGKYSYCLYICHQPLILILAKMGLNADHLVGRLHGRLVAIAAVNGIAFGSSVLIALVSWNVLEKQFLKLKELPALTFSDEEAQPNTHVGKS